MANAFFVRCDCRNRRFTGGKSRFLQEADGRKGIASAADELCGSALIGLSAFVNNGLGADYDTGDSSIGNFYGYYFKQTSNIDSSGNAWEQIGYSGSYYFAGNYDGSNYTILNMTSTGKMMGMVLPPPDCSTG